MPLVGYAVEASDGQCCEKRGAGIQVEAQRVEQQCAENKVLGEMANR